MPKQKGKASGFADLKKQAVNYFKQTILGMLEVHAGYLQFVHGLLQILLDTPEGQYRTEWSR